MNNNDLLVLVDKIQKRSHELLENKGKEYAHADDRLANFKRIGTLLGLKPAQVCLVYFHKHLDGIVSFVNSGEIYSGESLHERIVDAVNYLILLHAILDEHTHVNDSIGYATFNTEVAQAFGNGLKESINKIPPIMDQLDHWNDKLALNKRLDEIEQQINLLHRNIIAKYTQTKKKPIKRTRRK